MSDFCAKEPRVMEFGDEVLVASQHPYNKTYETNMDCVMNFTRKPDDVGIILNVLYVETQTCEDVLTVKPSESERLTFCGQRKNTTGNMYIYSNETLHVRWHTSNHETPLLTGRGFEILFTAYQTECKDDQSCFECGNGLIIDQVHMCNGLNNCGDNSDEADCPVPKECVCSCSSVGLIIVSVLFALSLLSLIGVAVWSYKKFTAPASRRRSGKSFRWRAILKVD